ncbi:hypothetical protein NPIL_225281 [Nephila pilipes]|uniref:Uncharacterized protein n=1 Tax=Nephila pilipes TaxID=299642 RepID=A0A8X6UVW0_NEPPI|nr:hypothetical protein NPIL_225281 [Nephila pilipes]
MQQRYLIIQLISARLNKGTCTQSGQVKEVPEPDIENPEYLGRVWICNTPPGPPRKRIRPCDPDFGKTAMQWFEEYEVSKDDADVSDAEWIIRNHEESEQECEENSNVDSEEEDDIFDMGNYYNGKRKKKKNRFKWFKKLLVSSHYKTQNHNIVLKLSIIRPNFRRMSD